MSASAFPYNMKNGCIPDFADFSNILHRHEVIGRNLILRFRKLSTKLVTLTYIQ
jgi:hypothetical protein